MTEELSKLKEQYLRCVRCGQCRSVCPVFAEVRNETATPRGKVFLAHMLASGEIKASEEASFQMSRCLLCQACTKECPSAIPVHKIVTATRTLLAKAIPSPLQRLVFEKIWTNPAMLNLSAGLIRNCQGMGLLDLGISGGLLPRGFSQPGRLSRRPARAFLPEVTPAAGKVVKRVGYFLGCSTNFLFPEVARSVTAVLARLGCEVIIPNDLRCCGLPQAESGYEQATGPLARANYEAFRRLGVDTVVTDCASCAAALKENEKFGINVLDLSGLLVDLLAIKKPDLQKIKKAVTYHDPCHLARAQGITDEPRELLRLVCSEYRDMRGAGDCCGGGGAFALQHYDVSMGILRNKIASIKETKAETVATFCPACIMQLRHGLSKDGCDVTVAHPVQLLAQSLGISPSRY